jgi:methyltransferase NSUN6
VTATLRELEQAANYQRMLIREAVHVLAVGGEMVYSTCTLNPAENEGNVRWLLDRYPQMELTEQSPRLGGPGIEGKGFVPCSRTGGRREEQWLHAHEAKRVQRFDVTTGLDTIAFFIAKLRKVASIPEEDGCVPIPVSLGTVAEE